MKKTKNMTERDTKNCVKLEHMVSKEQAWGLKQSIVKQASKSPDL